MMLDYDIVGFVGEDEFMEFGYPYIKSFTMLKASVNFSITMQIVLCRKYNYPQFGINLYNPGTHMR
jgi:hypothetical protein